MPSSLSRSAVLSDIRRNRAVIPAGLLAARDLVQTYTVTRKRPLVVAGWLAAIRAMAALAANPRKGQP